MASSTASVKLALSVGMNRDPSTAQMDQGTVDISYSPIVSSWSAGWDDKKSPKKFTLFPQLDDLIPYTYFRILHPVGKGLQFNLCDSWSVGLFDVSCFMRGCSVFLYTFCVYSRKLVHVQ